MTSKAIDIQNWNTGLDQFSLTFSLSDNNTIFPDHQGVVCVSLREISSIPGASAQSYPDLPMSAESETLPGSAESQALKHTTELERTEDIESADATGSRPHQGSDVPTKQVEATHLSGTVESSDLGPRTPHHEENADVTEEMQPENPGPAVRLAGNHAAIERLDLTTSLDTTTPSSTSDQRAVEPVIPGTQEEAGLEMREEQVDGMAPEQPDHLLIEGTHGMTVTIESKGCANQEQENLIEIDDTVGQDSSPSPHPLTSSTSPRDAAKTRKRRMEDDSTSEESRRVRRRCSRKHKDATRTDFVNFEDMRKAKFLLNTCQVEGISVENLIKVIQLASRYSGSQSALIHE